MSIADLLIAVLGAGLIVTALAAVLAGAWEWIPGVNEPGYLHHDDRRKGGGGDA